MSRPSEQIRRETKHNLLCTISWWVRNSDRGRTSCDRQLKRNNWWCDEADVLLSTPGTRGNNYFYFVLCNYRHEDERWFRRAHGHESNDGQGLLLCLPLYLRHLLRQWDSLLAAGLLRTWRQRFHICAAFWNKSVLAAWGYSEYEFAAQSQMNNE